MNPFGQSRYHFEEFAICKHPTQSVGVSDLRLF